VGALDALFLRNESIDDLQERPWASPLGLVFGQMIKARGVTVVNDPMSLIRATSKLYLEEFPENIRPRSLVTRDPEAIGAVRRQGRPLRPQAAVRSQRTERVHDRE
jgi:glutathione synthase